MFEAINIKSQVFYYGIPVLNQSSRAGEFMGTYKPHIVKTLIKKLLRCPYLMQLKSYDVIIIIQAKPDIFLKSLGVETIRKLFPEKPIVLYDLDYCPRHLDMWSVFEFKKELHHGLEKYDWYLCASDVWERPMPEGHQPYSRIGVNINDGTLFPEQGSEFIALVDFERSSEMEARAIQIQALEKTNTKYIVLSGNYSIKAIREIYRKCSIYFVACEEAFGLPICELQACGSHVFTPYPDWCYAHGHKKDLTVSGLGTLSPNFIVYHNDLYKLIAEIDRIKDSYDPQRVLDNFKHYDSDFYGGDIAALQKFIDMIERNEIESTSHRNYLETVNPV